MAGGDKSDRKSMQEEGLALVEKLGSDGARREGLEGGNGWAYVVSILQPVIRCGRASPSGKARMRPTLKLRLQRGSAASLIRIKQILDYAAGCSVANVGY